MNVLQNFVEFAGEWNGTNRLWLGPDDLEESPSSAVLTPVLGGRFVRLDQSWVYKNRPQSGSLLMGFDKETNTFTGHWIDTFHMGNKVLSCVGAASDENVFKVLGAYAVPNGPSWGWRIELKPGMSQQFVIQMFNIHPDGVEDLAVQADYSPATT